MRNPRYMVFLKSKSKEKRYLKADRIIAQCKEKVNWIDLFSLYVLFSQCWSCDNTLENCSFYYVLFTCIYARIIHETTKVNRSKTMLGAIHLTKIQTGLTGKSGSPQKVDRFFRNFSGWTEPIHWVLDRNFRKFWLNGSRPLYPYYLRKWAGRFSIMLIRGNTVSKILYLGELWFCQLQV